MMTREKICKQIASLIQPIEETFPIDHRIVETSIPSSEFYILQKEQLTADKTFRTDYQVIFPSHVKAVVFNNANQIAFVLNNGTLELPGGIISDEEESKSDRQKAFDTIQRELQSLHIDLIRLRIATDNPFNLLKGGHADYHFFWGIISSEEEANVIWISSMFVMKELRIFHDKGKFFGCGLDTASYFGLLDYFMYN